MANLGYVMKTLCQKAKGRMLACVGQWISFLAASLNESLFHNGHISVFVLVSRVVVPTPQRIIARRAGKCLLQGPFAFSALPYVTCGLAVLFRMSLPQEGRKHQTNRKVYAWLLCGYFWL